MCDIHVAVNAFVHGLQCIDSTHKWPQKAMDNNVNCDPLHIFQFLSAILEYNVSDSLNSNMLGFYHNCLYHLECAMFGIDQLANFWMYKFIYVSTWFNGSCFPRKFLNRMHSTSKWNTFTYFISLEMILSYLDIHCKLIYKYQVISKWE